MDDLSVNCFLRIVLFPKPKKFPTNSFVLFLLPRLHQLQFCHLLILGGGFLLVIMSISQLKHLHHKVYKIFL